jgi:hypothetical protein
MNMRQLVRAQEAFKNSFLRLRSRIWPDVAGALFVRRGRQTARVPTCLKRSDFLEIASPHLNTTWPCAQMINFNQE